MGVLAELQGRATTQWLVAERDSTVSIGVVRGLVDAAGAAGADTRSLLEAARIQRPLLELDDARVPRSRVLLLCELALDMTDEPAFALHWGEHASESIFAPLSHLIAHAANLGEGLQTLFDYHRLVADEASCSLIQEDDVMTLRLTTLPNVSARLRMFVVEMEAVGIHRLMKTFGVEPERVSFAYPAPEHRGEYARIFQGAEQFDAPLSAITFSRSLLGAVSPHRDEEIHNALRAIASQRVQRLTKSTPYAWLLREQLIKQRMPTRPKMGEAAYALGLSVRSLRRRLKDEGKTFYDVATEAATIIAKDLLSDARKSIQEVAFEMGFADTSGFHRAFKRWTGVTPTVYRDDW